jgi:hypothetical protein
MHFLEEICIEIFSYLTEAEQMILYRLLDEPTELSALVGSLRFNYWPTKNGCGDYYTPFIRYKPLTTIKKIMGNLYDDSINTKLLVYNQVQDITITEDVMTTGPKRKFIDAIDVKNVTICDCKRLETVKLSPFTECLIVKDCTHRVEVIPKYSDSVSAIKKISGRYIVLDNPKLFEMCKDYAKIGVINNIPDDKLINNNITEMKIYALPGYLECKQLKKLSFSRIGDTSVVIAPDVTVLKCRIKKDKKKDYLSKLTALINKSFPKLQKMTISVGKKFYADGESVTMKSDIQLQELMIIFKHISKDTKLHITFPNVANVTVIQNPVLDKSDF